MKSKDGFVQAYNAQAAVDAHAQIIVAQDVTQSGVDCGQLVPMIDAVEANLGRMPEQASADSGYCSQSNLEALESRHIDGYVATGRAKDAVAGATKGEVSAEATDASAATDSSQPTKAPTRVEAMRAKIKAGGHNSLSLLKTVKCRENLQIFPRHAHTVSHDHHSIRTRFHLRQPLPFNTVCSNRAQP
jgi:Transposase DDE domain